MSRTLALLGILLGGGLLLAAPISIDSPGEPLPPEEARAYAQSLQDVILQVQRYYVRPVSHRDLLYAAISGLYEEVRAPVPETLRADLDKAVVDYCPPPAGANVPEVSGFGGPAQEVLIRARAALGEREALHGMNALRVSIQAMVRSLDPYSDLVSGDYLRRANGEDLNYGVGLELMDNGGAGPLIVKTVVPGSPAQKADIRPGDQVAHLSGMAVEASRISSAEALRRLNGNPDEEKGKSVVLTVCRASKAARQVTLLADYFRPEMVAGLRRQENSSWDYWADRPRRLACIRVGALDHGVGDQLQQVVSNLKEDGLRGLVLDLRWSPGGYLTEAVLVARLFLNEGEQIACVKSRTEPDKPYLAQADSPFTGLPLVVLVNGETSGGSELIAAALQDNRRAVVVGQRTLGKASVQTPLALPLPNMGLKLTSGSFVRPSGKALHRFPESKLSDDWGVLPLPEHRLPVTPDLSRQLRDGWLLMTLRPAESNDPLPIDDPDSDPQSRAALEVLRDSMK